MSENEVFFTIVTNAKRVFCVCTSCVSIIDRFIHIRDVYLLLVPNTALCYLSFNVKKGGIYTASLSFSLNILMGKITEIHVPIMFWLTMLKCRFAAHICSIHNCVHALLKVFPHFWSQSGNAPFIWNRNSSVY